MGIPTEQEDRYFPWFAFFDMESILEKTQEFQSEKLVWTAHHKPVSVSICSNVPGFTEPNCIVEADLDQLLMKMIDYLSGIQNEAKTLAYEKWNDVIEQLENNDDDDDDDECKSDGKQQEKSMKELSKKFQHYCHQLPVLGFNSAKYDLNLVKSKLAYHLNLAEDDCFVIKQNSAYTCISTSQFKFLDIMNFLAPGCSYDKFLKAYQTESEKGFFCYEYFDSMEKLEETSLPPNEAFYSELKGAYVCNREEYEKLQEIWREKEIKNLLDFLVWYNNLDTAPAIEAIEKMMTFYREYGS